MKEGKSGEVERLVRALVLEGKEEVVKLVEKWRKGDCGGVS